MLSSQVSEKETRKINRISLALPLRVETQVDQKVFWSEITRLSDVSAFGAGFNLKRPIKRGRVVQMIMPLPRQLRCFDFMEPQYRVWGIIRRCVKTRGENESYAHGVAFIGKNPPPGFNDNPAKLFDITTRGNEGLWNVTEAALRPDESHLPKDQRRHSRFPIPESVLVEVLDDEGNVVKSESTVTENLSLGGASIFTTLDVGIGTFLRVISQRYSTTIISVIRGKRQGPDGIPRIHVEFIDHFFPLEGIE